MWLLGVNDFEHSIDNHNNVNTNYISFSVESNMHYRYSSLDNLLNNLDDLAAMIDHHYNNQVPRLAVLDDYYKARNTNVISNRRRKEEDKADHRPAHNFAKVITQFDVGYNTGKAIKVETDDKSNQTAIDDFDLINDIDGLNSELWLDMDKYGRSYALQYRNNDDENRIALANVFETFVIYDTTIDRNIIAAVRYPKASFSSDADEMKINPILYTDKEVLSYQTTTINAINLIEPKVESHSFGEVPIEEYSTNRFRQGIYEDVLSLIDLYDYSQADTANYMTDLNDALLLLQGDIENSGLTTDEAIRQKDANMLMLQSGIGIDGKQTSVSAGYIYKQYDVNGTEAYKKRVQADIHKISNVPDLTDENFSGNQSGEAMKYKLFGFEQMTAVKQRLFEKGLRRRYRLLFNSKTQTKEADNANLDLRITFSPNLPKAIKDELAMLTEAGAVFSQQTLLSQASFVDSPKNEQDRIEEEQPKSKTSPIFDNQKVIEEAKEDE